MKQIIFILTSLLTFSAFAQKTAKELIDDLDKKSPLYYDLEKEYMNSNSDMMEKWYEFDLWGCLINRILMVKPTNIE